MRIVLDAMGSDAAPDPASDPGLGFLLGDVARLMRRNFDRRVRPLGLTQAQWRALAQLSRSEGTNQASLAETLAREGVS